MKGKGKEKGKGQKEKGKSGGAAYRSSPLPFSF
jgi:hypothetical protein